ncbi:hypothetical protein HNQ80_000862 [Anaerosolibacter carboniphilus]|uniref:Uncharacterized protein n=1 Tax=Anaerosolibacter carboniphilus TaxID=1417629 RepID=A0A841KMW0_9FIRM|nr:hypothetical protein [Anaerosolibacter carboniphilus]
MEHLMEQTLEKITKLDEKVDRIENKLDSVF